MHGKCRVIYGTAFRNVMGNTANSTNVSIIKAYTRNAHMSYALKFTPMISPNIII